MKLALVSTGKIRPASDLDHEARYAPLTWTAFQKYVTAKLIQQNSKFAESLVLQSFHSSNKASGTADPACMDISSRCGIAHSVDTVSWLPK